MKIGRLSEPQILGILKQADSGAPVSELCREHGMSSASLTLIAALIALRHHRLGLTHHGIRHPHDHLAFINARVDLNDHTRWLGVAPAVTEEY
jgi:putative transposase